MSTHLFSYFNILGGLALFLYGVEKTTAAFGSSFGAGSKDLMVRFTRQKPMAFLFGVALAAIAQGSTVATSFAIGFVDVGMLSFAGSVVVMMGASVGGTFVTFLLSLDIAVISPLLFAVSLLLVRYGRGKAYRLGTVLQGLSLLLLGMFVLKLGVQPLLATPGFAALAAHAGENGFLTGIAAFVVTAILQNSSAVMALAVTLATSGAMPVAAVLPVILGSHVGSSVTTLIAGMSGKQNARKLGICSFVYKVLCLPLYIPVLPWFENYIFNGPGGLASKIVLAQVGVALYNAVVFYPFTETLARFSAAIAERAGRERLAAPVYLDEDLLEIPSLAILLLSKEMIRLANYIEMYCQVLFVSGPNGNKVFQELPGAIRELSEACEEYMYGIHIPSDDDVLRENYSTVSYSMVSFRQMAKILSGELRLLAEAGVGGQLARELGKTTWDELTRVAMTDIRLALRAFALGDVDFAVVAGKYEREFEELDRRIRLRLGADALNRRELAPLVDFLSQIFLLVKTSLEIARGEAYREGMVRK
ncbi:Na/Pi-cotransporter [Aminivibrio pyruvatiphilus]|uniref:Na/Pi-cotransporter n=1 Tax=Aminivibrio pyruvatiphilus TaxID=1005740 RepID=A0A4R8M845_9BACT|nr:Na/Pi symporter [Aminivibrio pyruvatiphilus]TDY61699.1 Na/Pi-cotransporter [Aminivibrio pyruvatiphilus]